MKAKRIPLLVIAGAVLVTMIGIALIPVPKPKPDFSRRAGEVPASAATEPANPASAVRSIAWAELIPRDWDPAREVSELRQDLSAVSDADPRAHAILDRMRCVWDHAPTVPSMNGVEVRIPGSIVPLDSPRSGHVGFLLVPYFGACIHSPPPPSNQIIHVHARQATIAPHSMDTVWVSGTLSTAHSESETGASRYRLDADTIVAYVLNR